MEDAKFNWDFIVAATAVIALAQPWVISFVKKRRGRVDILPNKSFMLGFDKRGVSVTLNTVLVSREVASTISNMTLKIKKGEKLINEFDWDIFMNPYENWYSSGDTSVSQTTATYAHQVFLNNDKSEVFKIQFNDPTSEMKTKEYIQNGNRDDLLLQCNYEDGNYTCEFEVMDIDGKKYTCLRSFTLNKEEARLLRNSVDALLEGATGTHINLKFDV